MDLGPLGRVRLCITLICRRAEPFYNGHPLNANVFLCTCAVDAAGTGPFVHVRR